MPNEHIFIGIPRQQGLSGRQQIRPTRIGQRDAGKGGNPWRRFQIQRLYQRRTIRPLMLRVVPQHPRRIRPHFFFRIGQQGRHLGQMSRGLHTQLTQSPDAVQPFEQGLPWNRSRRKYRCRLSLRFGHQRKLRALTHPLVLVVQQRGQLVRRQRLEAGRKPRAHPLLLYPVRRIGSGQGIDIAAFGLYPAGNKVAHVQLAVVAPIDQYSLPSGPQAKPLRSCPE